MSGKLVEMSEDKESRWGGLGERMEKMGEVERIPVKFTKQE